MSRITLAIAAFAFLLLAACNKRPTPEKLEDMAAIDVAKNPAAHGFEKGGSMATNPTEAGLRQGMKPTREDQWTKKTPEGKVYILTIRYDEHNKLISARWGGF